jgi:molybdenum cofactor cytidylyltransferase
MRRRYNRGVVPAIVLAAGASSRMGRSKAMLGCGDSPETFVSRILRTLRDGGAAGAFVVGRQNDDPLRAEVERVGPFATFTVNPTPERGQLSSLIAGLNAADRPGVRGVMVTPVDVPLIRAATIATLIATFDATRAPIVRAVHGQSHGHPVIFARFVFDDLRHADPAHGAKAVLRAHDDRIVNVEVNDPGVLADVDAPEDYERLFGDRP